jgi:hypothetical protein
LSQVAVAVEQITVVVQVQVVIEQQQGFQYQAQKL